MDFIIRVHISLYDLIYLQDIGVGKQILKGS